MAFQIVDDILDFTGDQIEIGKPVANDLRQGLVTLPAIKYLEEYPDDPDMKTVVENRIVSEDSILKVVKAIRNSGAIESSMEEASVFIDRGLTALNSLPKTKERQALEDLAKFVVSRHL